MLRARSFRLGFVAALATVARPAIAAPQTQPASPVPPAQRSDALSGPLAAARKALAAGKKAEAIAPLQLALLAAPGSTEVLALFVDACSEDDDARAFWQLALATAAASQGGTLALDAAEKKRLPADDPRPAQVAQSLALAVEELVELARQREKDGVTHVDSLLVARWARRFALDLARSSPALLRAHANDLSPRLTLAESLPAKVVKALESRAGNALRNSRGAEAVEAARILAGLGVQSSWDDDLQGPQPVGLGNLRKSSVELLARARALLADKLEAPWTVDELLYLDADQAEAFTRVHDSFANPGVATSPRGWYRVETDCGYETLLGTTQTVELHHERLAKWYGEDPFVGKPGLVRIVPEARGLEAEQAPFWWAGGFQAGDLTVFRFSCDGGPTIEGLGHGLTHELTHRFDGALFPGLPAWLGEGKAVWTGAAFASAASPTFVENYASIGGIEAAYIKGYGDPEKLAKLIEGTIDDYRDNYVAGHALYVYLMSRKGPDGKRLHRERLLEFQQKARGAKKWKELFAACFCDGRAGRPKTFDELCADWTPWVAGFYWQDRKPWAQEFTQDIPRPDKDPIVMDEPVWVWSRHRAEPRFGQEQAAAAGRLFLAAGQRAETIAALTWALAVDGRRPLEEALLAEVLAQENKKDAAWVLRAELELPHGERIGAPPFKAQLPKTLAHLQALDAARTDAHARARPLTAAALRADRERAASWLGLERAEATEAIETRAAPIRFDTPSRLLAATGWTESGLTGYEERRAKGRWCVDDEGHLIVGRETPKEKVLATGGGIATVDRAAAQVDCFALAPEWLLPGTWRLECRIRFLTSYVGAAVIFGYTERDANGRFSFSAGDYQYAIGASEQQQHDFKSLHGWLTGLRDREGPLPGAADGGGIEFDTPQSSFWLTLEVDGALVEAFVNGKPIGSYHTVDGAPIEGQIGFATSMGVIEVEDARVTRLERSRLAPAAEFTARVFDLASQSSLLPWEAVRAPAVGLPKAPQGTLLQWIAPPDKPLEDEVARESYAQRVLRSVRDLAPFFQRNAPTQRLVIALPVAIEAERRAKMAAEAQQLFGEHVEVRTHAHALPPRAPDATGPPTTRPGAAWLLFVDQAGCVRATTRLQGAKLVDEGSFMRWMGVFREHGRPERELPAVERAKPEPTEPPKSERGR